MDDKTHFSWPCREGPPTCCAFPVPIPAVLATAVFFQIPFPGVIENAVFFIVFPFPFPGVIEKALFFQFPFPGVIENAVFFLFLFFSVYEVLCFSVPFPFPSSLPVPFADSPCFPKGKCAATFFKRKFFKQKNLQRTFLGKTQGIREGNWERELGSLPVPFQFPSQFPSRIPCVFPRKVRCNFF